MKIILKTTSAQGLINQIFKSVKDETLKTWEIRKDKDGNEFLTHSPEQWSDIALLKFIPQKDRLDIQFAWWQKNDEPTLEIKGYYIGRITEILLVHFANMFDEFEIIK